MFPVVFHSEEILIKSKIRLPFFYLIVINLE